MPIELIDPAEVPHPIAEYTAGARLNNLLFLSGQLPSNFPAGVPKELRRQDGYPYLPL